MASQTYSSVVQKAFPYHDGIIVWQVCISCWKNLMDQWQWQYKALPIYMTHNVITTILLSRSIRFFLCIVIIFSYTLIRYREWIPDDGRWTFMDDIHKWICYSQVNINFAQICTGGNNWRIWRHNASASPSCNVAIPNWKRIFLATMAKPVQKSVISDHK